MEEEIEKLKQKLENRKSLMLYNKELEKEYERDIEAIENLINKNKKLRQLVLDNRNLYHEQIEKAEKEIKRLRDKIDDLEMNEKEYERREKEANKNMVATLEESLKYCFKIKDLERRNEELKKMIELMLIDLSDGAFYMDDAAQNCEVKHKECDGNVNIDCKECLFEYYKKKVRVIQWEKMKNQK